MSLSRVEASDDAARRRRAEYVVLRLLGHRGAVPVDDIDEAVEGLHRGLDDTPFESPFYFRVGGSNGPESDELNESIERLLRYGRIERSPESGYRLTDAGEEYLEDEEQLRLDRIAEDFREWIRNRLRDR